MKRLLRAGGPSLTSVVTQGLSRFLYSVIIARFMVPGSLADINTLISIGMFASMLLPASIASAATLFIARARGSNDRALEAATIRLLRQRALLGSTTLGVLAAIYTLVVFAPGRWDSAAYSFLIVVGFGLSSFVRGALYATERGPRAASLDATALLVAIGGLAIIVSVGLDGWALAPLVAGYGVVIVAGWPRAERVPSVPVGRSDIDRFIAWGVLAVVATGGFLQITMILAQAIGTTHESDLYAAALALATPASMLTSVASLILFPSISRAVGRGDAASVHRQSDIALRVLTVVLVGAFGALILLGPLLLVLLFGETFASAAHFLAILLVATLFGAIVGPAVDALSSAGRAGIRQIALLRIGGFVIGGIAIVVLVPSNGILGVALGYLVGMIVSGTGPIILAWRTLHHRWGGIALRFIGGLLLLGICFVLQRVWGEVIWSVLASTALFGVVWFFIAASVVRKAIVASPATHSSR